MKVFLKKALCITLILCTLVSFATPFSLLAAEDGGREYIFRETFSGESINTSGSKANCVAADGLFVCHENGSTYTLENGTLKYTSRLPKDYTDLRFYYEETARDCTEDFVLSFWLKPDVDNFKLTTMTWKQYSASVQENGIFKIMDGCYQINGTTYKDAHLPKDKWSLVEIVFHYDETATAVTGETGATTYYTFMLNGETVKDESGKVVECPATYYFHNIDRYRFLQWAYGTYELDDLTIALGTESLIDVPRTDPNAPVEETREFFYRETFSGGSINTNNVNADIVAANGFWANNQNGSVYNLEDDALNFTTRPAKDFIDLRYYLDGLNMEFKEDFIFSFWIKPTTDTQGVDFAWRDNAHSTWETIFKLSGGCLWVNGIKYTDAKLKKDTWALVEVVAYYNETATSVTGETGATTKYAFMLNGKVIAEADATILFHNIDNYRVFRYANAPFSIDDLSIASGTDSLIDIPRTALGTEDVERTVFYREEFDKGYVNAQNTPSAIVGADGFWLNATNGLQYNTENDALNITSLPSGDGFIDLRYFLDGLKKDISEDFLFSVWVKPENDAFGATFAWRDDAHSTWESMFKISGGCFMVNGTKYTTAKLPKDEWSLVEIAAYYDDAATAVTGEKGATVKYAFMLNGVKIAEADATVLFHNIDYYRVFRYANAPFSIDDLSIVSGTDSLIYIGRTQPAEKEKTEILFNEDFSAPISTDADTSANGLFLCDDYGTLFTQENGTLRYTQAMVKDYLALQFYNEKTKLNLSRDFILSFRIRTEDLFTFRMQWKDHNYSAYETSMKIMGNRFVCSDDYNSNGQINADVFLYPNQWAQIEVAFHYDEGIKAVTGEQGAIAYYTIILNGEPVQTVKTQNNFHTIDDFRLFTQINYEFEVDDIVIVTGNESIADGYNASGWEKHEYFCDAEPVTDYDYSIVVVGDTQCMAAWYPEDFATTYNWLVNNVEAQKTQIVIGVGDITNNDTDKEWNTATESLFKLNGVVPYVLVRGNHDGSENYNKYLNVPSYTDQFNGKGGFFGEESVECSYYAFDVGNEKYLFIGLDFGPTDAELAWAGELIAANPDRKVIITTHGYLGSDGKTLNKNDAGAPSTYESGANDGNDIWEKLGSKYENVAFIISGHIGTDRMVANKVTGDHGNTVTQLLIDYQGADNTLQGLGLVTTLYFKEGSPDIVVRNYATVQEKYFGEDNQFTLNTEADKPAKLPDIIFKEDFSSGSINTDPDADKVSDANGIFVCVESGTEYTLENGTLKYTKRISSDYIDIRFCYDNTLQNLARDFTLSFKIKPLCYNLSAQFAWKDRDYDTWDNSLELSGGRFRANGNTNPDAVLKANEWSLVEIAFHFNPDTLSVTGQRGAIDSYTVMLNGEPVQTVEAMYGFNNIDFFRLFRYSNGEYELDDLTVASTNTTFAGGQFDGWDKEEYYFDKEPISADSYAYSFVIVGDTQKVTRHYPSKLAEIYDWILENKDSKKIGFVFGLGDITDTDKDTEWTVAKEAIFGLNGRVPYSLVRGNHDGSEGINTYFYVDEYTSQFEGFFGEGSMENSWRLLDIGEAKYLLITLDFGPTDAELEWAGKIIEAYPDRKVIISTHTFTKANGGIIDADHSHAPSRYDETSNNGDGIWNKLASKYENVFLILSGHIGCDYVVTSQLEGIHGNTVTHMLVDPQVIDGEIGPSGMVTVLYFSNDGSSIYVETYSTINEKYFMEENQFTVDISDWADFDKTEGTIGENLTWKFENGTLTVSGKGRMPVFNYGEAPWAAIMDKITAVVIEEGVTSIGRTSFHSAANLTSVTLPEGLKRIDDYAFYGCTALKTVTIPASVTEIGAYAFRKSGVDNAEFAISYGWSCGDSAFASAMVTSDGAAMLKSFYKTKWVRDVKAEPDVIDPNYVDSGICGNGLKWTLTYIDPVKKTMKLTVSGTGKMTEFGTAGAPWYEYAWDIVEVEVESGVTSIGRCAFFFLRRLTKVTIADTVTVIGDYAFNTCWSLKEITLPEGVTKIGTDAFKKTGLAEIPTVL